MWWCGEHRGNVLTPQQRGVLRSVATGAVWARERLRRVGFDTDGLCELCGVVADTVHHRVWACLAEVPKRAREVCAPPPLVEEAMRQDPNDPLWARGWAPHPAGEVPPPAADGGVPFTRGGVRSEDPTWWGMSGWVCCDGSCAVSDHPEMRRAA